MKKIKKKNQFKDLTHHKEKNILLYLDFIFNKKLIDFKNKKILDVGGGSGICSFYGYFKNCKSAINLEPILSGSNHNAIDGFKSYLKKNSSIKNIKHINKKFQNFISEDKFDYIIFHDSINHLNEGVYQNLIIDKNSKEYFYKFYISKIDSLIKKKGKVIITDCSPVNFYNFFGFKNPFAPSINWKLHKDPNTLRYFFENYGYEILTIKWTPLKRLGNFGIFLSKFGRCFAFFLQSHFVMIVQKN